MLVLRLGGQIQLVEQDLASCLGELMLKGWPDRLVDARARASMLALQPLGHGVQERHVQVHAGQLHTGQHRDQGHLHIAEQIDTAPARAAAAPASSRRRRVISASAAA